MVPADLKYLFVEVLADYCEKNGVGFRDHLLTLAGERLAEVQRGKIVIGTSGNGRQTTLQIPSDFTPRDAAGLVAEVSRRYREARAKLVADGTASPSDSAIVVEILDKIHPVENVESDFRNLRYAPTEVEE